MPVLCDRGGVHKLQAAFATAELARKAKLEKMQAALVRGEAQAAQVDEVRRTAVLVLGSWGNTMRDAVRNK